jgi:hypothetical protein
MNKEPHNAAAHRSTRRENISNMSTTTPSYEINYDRTTGDFNCYINEEYIGSRATYWAGQELVDEQLTILAELDAQDVAPEPTIEAQLAAQGIRRASGDEAGWYALVEQQSKTIKVWATDEPAPLPAPVQDVLDTLDDTPALPAVFTATDANPLDAMIQALEQAESLIARLGTKVVSQTSEVTISVCGQPLTTVVVVVAPRVVAKVAA